MTTDVEKIISDEHHNGTLACAKIARLIQEGLNDTCTLPEVHSEAARAAHLLLGCNIWGALYVQAFGLHQVKKTNPDLPEQIERIVAKVITDQVVDYAALIVHHRGPIGETDCGIEINND